MHVAQSSTETENSESVEKRFKCTLVSMRNENRPATKAKTYKCQNIRKADCQ